MDEKELALERVLSAIRNPGIAPSYHQSMKVKLMREWPVLAHALQALDVAYRD